MRSSVLRAALEVASQRDRLQPDAGAEEQLGMFCIEEKLLLGFFWS